jgi:hypothetical protein
MNKIHAALAIAFVALSTTAFAQDTLPNPGTDAARQQRMNEAYADHRAGPVARTEEATKHDARVASNTVSEDTHRAGHAIHNGVRETGHAIHRGVRATGHAIHNGVRATGHAIHHGVDKVTGK